MFEIWSLEFGFSFPILSVVTLKLPPFATFRNNQLWEEFISQKLAPFEQNLTDYLHYWYLESQENSHTYPSQGMLITPYDDLGHYSKGMISPNYMLHVLRVRQYFLEVFNHPERIAQLQVVQKQKFVAPQAVTSQIMEQLVNDEIAVAVSDLGVRVVGSQTERVSRKKRLMYGPFVKLGRYARSILVGSAMPDIYGSVSAISTMAQCLSLVCVPRNGPFSEISCQVDLVKDVFQALEQSEVLIGRSPSEQKFLIKTWKHNVMGVVDAEPDKAVERSLALYAVGVRTFRVYSPEPGLGPLNAVKALRKQFGSSIEIFVGQVVDVQQAQQLEAAGADGLYIGIGGGGRCITGVRSGSVIDWPILLWEMRGQISIPVIVEGGGSDHIATTLALGASGIGVSRIAGGGTIESPGGMLYLIDDKGNYFKPYGGEASARTKYLDKKILPFEIPSFVEGETRAAYMNHLSYGVPTIPFHIHNLTEDIILSFVFRGAENVIDFQNIKPSPLRRNTSEGANSQQTH